MVPQTKVPKAEYYNHHHHHHNKLNGSQNTY